MIILACCIIGMPGMCPSFYVIDVFQILGISAKLSQVINNYVYIIKKILGMILELCRVRDAALNCVL